jgi:glucokinase
MTVHQAEEHVLGLDIGGTKLAAGVVSSTGRVLSYDRTPSLIEQGPDATIERLFSLADDALRTAGCDVTAVGIGCGGPLDVPRGIVLSPPGLRDWAGIPIADRASERFGVPAHLDNDGTAGAFGEYLFGPWRPARSLAYLTIGTGIGGGLVLDGRPYRGSTGNGVEFGHLVVDWQGRTCNCGQRGCAEAYVSGTSIGARAREALAIGRKSTLGGRTVTAAQVADAARQGDELASEIWDESMRILGRLVAQVINAVEPELVVLGGGVTREGQMLIEPVRRYGLGGVMSPSSVHTQVHLAALGDQVGVLGAAAITFDPMRSAGMPGRP